MKYFGSFENYGQMMELWGDVKKTPIPTDDEILFASYEDESYEGSALVIFQHGGKLYEVNGGHCSCFGLSESGYSGESESQWEPEETSWAALKMRQSSLTGFADFIAAQDKV